MENYGTDPDIVIEMTPQDYAAGRDPQLDRAIDEVLAIVERWGPSAPSFEPPPSRQASGLPLIDPPRPPPATPRPDAGGGGAMVLCQGERWSLDHPTPQTSVFSEVHGR